MTNALFGLLGDSQFRSDVGRGLLDAGNRGVAGLLGGPVDLATMALRPFGYSVPNPLGGSEWINQKMRDAGFVSPNRNALAELLSTVVLPAGAARAGGLLFRAEQSLAPKAGQMAQDAIESHMVKQGLIQPMVAMTNPAKTLQPADDLLPTSQQLKAWKLGLEHRRRLGDRKRTVDFYETLPSDELEFISRIEEMAPVSRGFYESALRGAEMPKPASGMRYGKAPANGFSWNHVDQRPEIGVSMASVEGLPYQWNPMQVVGPESRYRGWLLDANHFWGSDGEPLMLGLKSLTK